MWVIKHEVTNQFVKKIDRGDVVWTADIEGIDDEAKFTLLEEEETYRTMNLQNENAQPYEIP